MSELEVFAAALEISDAIQRSEYLAGVCGTDGELRQRLDVLLRSHEGAGSFLEAPVSPKLAAAVFAGEDETQQGEEIVAAPKKEPEGATQAEADDDEIDESALAFLQHSTKPGALGRLGHYEVLEVLGQGGFGTVVRAFDEKLHRMVAIKIMASRLAATSPARKRFIREARASAAIRHENVVNIHAIEEQPIPFLVMEYVAGETLQQRLDRTGPLDSADVLRIGVQIAHGLAAAHAMGRIHRDIKPANILLENGIDRVKITDFGLARAADDASLTQSGVIAGTPLYMAPEQAQGLTIDHRADLFSLGSVLYVMCCGRPPFRASTTLAVLKRVAEDTPRSIRESIPEVPQWLCDIIARLHSKKPEERFQTAQEVADLFEQYLAEVHKHGKVHESVTNKPVLAQAATIRPAARRKGPWMLAAAAALVLLPLIGLVYGEATGVTDMTAAIRRLFAGEQIVAINSNKDKTPIELKTKPVAVPPIASDPDRRAADWVLSIGGTVRVNGQRQAIVDPVGLPEGVFRLNEVQLADNQLVSDEGLAHCKDCKNLTSLDVKKTKASAAMIYELTRALPQCRIAWDGPAIRLTLNADPDRRAAEYALAIGAVVSLKWGGTERYYETAGAVPQSPFEFRGANLNHNQNVRDAELAHFRECRTLRYLGLKGAPVSDAGLVHLKDCWTLKGLDLSDTNVSDVGLAHLKNHRNLSGLLLSATKVTDAGLAHFRECNNVTTAELSQTQISDEGLAQLAGYRKLVSVNVKNTQVTEAGVSRLAVALPKCKIEWNGGVIGPP